METPNRPSKSTEADPKPVRGGHIRWSGARGARNRPAPLRPAGAGKGPPTAAALASCSASSCWIWPARGGTMPSARVTEVAAPAPRLGATELPNQPICKSTTVSRLHLQGRVQVCGPPTKTSSFEAPRSRGMARPGLPRNTPRWGQFISAWSGAVRRGLQRAAHLLAVYRPERRSKILRGRCGGSPRLGARGGVGGLRG